MSFCHYRKSHCGDKTVVRLSSNLHNGKYYAGKMEASLYWISPQYSELPTTTGRTNKSVGWHIFRKLIKCMHKLNYRVTYIVGKLIKIQVQKYVQDGHFPKHIYTGNYYENKIIHLYFFPKIKAYPLLELICWSHKSVNWHYMQAGIRSQN